MHIAFKVEDDEGQVNLIVNNGPMDRIQIMTWQLECTDCHGHAIERKG